MRWNWIVTLSAVVSVPLPAFGQDTGTHPVNQIPWQYPGEVARIGSVATFNIPDGCRYTDGAGARKFAEIVQNLPNPRSLGLLFCELANGDGTEPILWFAEYEFAEDGYLKNAASEKLDASAILEAVRQGTAEGNEELRKRGWPTMEVLGWKHEPYFDANTSNATWALVGRSSDGQEAVNHRVRLLGRRGVLAINMISGPEDYGAAVSDLNQVVAGTAYVAGERYAEFQEGDKVAEYGLTTLIAGGAGAAAAKLGLFGKAWKLIVGLVASMWKLLAAAGVAMFGWVASLFRKKPDTVDTSRDNL